LAAQAREIQERKSQGQPTELLETTQARTEVDLARVLMRQRRYREAEAWLKKAGRNQHSDREEIQKIVTIDYLRIQSSKLFRQINFHIQQQGCYCWEYHFC
jgi:hypothetical protein